MFFYHKDTKNTKKKLGVLNAFVFKLSFFALLATFLFLLSCPISKISMHPDDWLMNRLPAEPDTLNPLTASDAYAGIIDNYIYEPLVDRNLDTLELYPKLASTWEISADGLVYTFKVRQGVKFQDGVPVTARDFKYCFDRIMDEKVNAPFLRNYYQDIRKAEVLDDYTIKFTYARPYFRALELCGGVQAIPKHLFERDPDFNKSPLGRAPVGTGPYKFVEWVTGQKIVLERNDAYWGQHHPQIKRIVFRVINESSSALIELKKRQIDLMDLSPLQWTKQTSSERFKEAFRKEQYYEPNFSYIGWNIRKPFFSDKRVRRAMTMMVDRPTLLKNLLFGLGIVVTGEAYVKSPYYDTAIQPWPYDPEGAKKLLDEAGWIDHDGDGIRDKDGVPFKFEFLIPSSSIFANQLGTVLKEELKKAGIVMEIRSLEWATFSKLVDGREFDAMAMGWSLSVETDPYQLWHSSQMGKGSNYVGFKNDEADRIIVEARRTFDRDKRIALLKRFHHILHDEQPYTFLFCQPSLVAISRRFGNVIIHNLGIEPKEWSAPKQALSIGR